MSHAGARPGFERRHADWLGWREARSRILASLDPGPAESLPLAEASGRALAEPVSATATLPPWDNSAMDGFAVRGDDVAGATSSEPVVLQVVARTRAGDMPAGALEPGQAARIMTGAPVPEGADSVIRVEHTDGEATEGRVVIHRDSDRGRNIRPGGQDVQAGQEVVEAGRSVTHGVVGVLAALGRAEVAVHRRPSVGIVVTGDELRPPERYEDVRRGRGIPESNGPMLAAAVEAAGAVAFRTAIAPDEPGALRTRLEEAAERDAVVTVGGASMGEADLVKRVLDGMGFETDFWRVRMRPGSPFSFGFLARPDGRSLPVFGLPGNPASAYVTFELFVRPALLRMGGHARVLRRTMVCRAGEALPGARGKTYFLRVGVDGQEPARVHLTGPQGSGLVRGLVGVQGLAVVPEDADGIPAGREVEVILLDDAPGALPWAGPSGG